MGNDTLHIGIDVGSTTVKLAVLNAQNEIVYSVYRRHHQKQLLKLLSLRPMLLLSLVVKMPRLSILITA